MSKKKVLSVFSLLTLFGLGLAMFSFSHFGSLTGRVVDESYSQELFMGNEYEFTFSPGLIKIDDGELLVEGILEENSGQEHNVQITGYAYNSIGEIVATLSKEVFLGINNNLNVKLRMYVGSEDIRELLIYFEDDKTSVRISKTFSDMNTMTGFAINENSSIKESTMPFLMGVIVLVSAILFIASHVKRHRKQENFENLFSQKSHRKYIDLDVR